MTENIWRISALASKMGQIKKKLWHFIIWNNPCDDKKVSSCLNFSYIIIDLLFKVGFFSESEILFSNLQICIQKILLQITILNLTFEIPAHNSIQLIHISSSGVIFFGGLDIWKANCTFWIKATFNVASLGPKSFLRHCLVTLAGTGQTDGQLPR